MTEKQEIGICRRCGADSAIKGTFYGMQMSVHHKYACLTDLYELFIQVMIFRCGWVEIAFKIPANGIDLSAVRVEKGQVINSISEMDY